MIWPYFMFGMRQSLCIGIKKQKNKTGNSIKPWAWLKHCSCNWRRTNRAIWCFNREIKVSWNWTHSFLCYSIFVLSGLFLRGFYWWLYDFYDEGLLQLNAFLIAAIWLTYQCQNVNQGGKKKTQFGSVKLYGKWLCWLSAIVALQRAF